MDIVQPNNLRILTEGEEGFGILVENDAGYISANQNQELIREMKENKLDFTQPIYIYATLQKYGTQNRNGRIYPEPILRREVNKYQQIINRNASFHELDHPECQRETAEILTSDGWKYIKDVSDNEMVYTLNPDNNQIELQQITKKINQPYKGKMIKITGRNVDLLVTPNHRFLFTNKRTNKSIFFTAQDILEHKVPVTEYYIPKLGDWVGDDHETILIKGVSADKLGLRCNKELVLKYAEDITIDSSIFHSFMGIWLADGSVKGSKGDTSYGYKISIAQKKKDGIVKIRELLKQMPFDWKESESKTGKVDFYCNDARLWYYLKPLGNSHTKYIPNELKNSSPHLLNQLIEWFQLGDGRTRGNKYKSSELFSTSKKLINDLHEILIKSGGAGNIKTEIREDRLIEGRIIKKENSKPIYFLHISTTKGLWFDYRNVTVSELDYNDNVYSVSVPNQTYYTRDNGKALWTGNSSVIALKGGSPHRIVELYWDGKTLIGKLEILVSRGYRESGIISCDGDLVAHYLSYGMTLGISSRGVGSIKKEGGHHIVQDDFELICWDIVSSPSTPGSYLYTDIKDKDKFQDELEPEEKENEKNMPENLTSSNKNDKFVTAFNKFLNR